eukprot:3064109-Alexandrium_andersonii.AAC.1
MSASLVGSEMCIRDSSEPCPKSAPAPSVLGLRARRGPSVLRVSDPAVPVSYTHLTLPTICSV